MGLVRVLGGLLASQRRGVVLLLKVQDLLLVLLQVLGASQVGRVVGLVHVESILVVVGQAVSDEVLASL